MTSDTPVVVGDRIELVPDELVAGGSALARIDGFPVFVRQIYPGDRALVEIEEVKSGFARGVLIELLQPGPLRKAEPCSVARTCGGCDWTELRLDQQLLAKQRILSESLRRVGKFAGLPPIRIHPSPLNYRLRSRLHLAGDRFGFFAERSKDVIQLVPECEVIGPQLHEALFGSTSLVDQLPAEGSLEAFESGEEFILAGEDSGAPASIVVDGFRYDLSTDAFFQVNRHLLPRLVDLVKEHAARCRVHKAALDLFSGVGFFSVPLARIFERVVAVEGSPVSHRWAQKNARDADNLRVLRSDVGRFLGGAREMFDFVFVDPPRAGLAPEVTDGIAAASRETICYLSCDPVTFSRDAARLARRGWSLRSLDLVDLFPNTHHIETLSSFERAP